MGIQNSVWVIYTLSQEFFIFLCFYFQIFLDIKEYYISVCFYFEFFLDVKEYYMGFFISHRITYYVLYDL